MSGWYSIKNILTKFLVRLWMLGGWRDVEWMIIGASNMELISMLYASVHVIYLLIAGKLD